MCGPSRPSQVEDGEAGSRFTRGVAVIFVILFAAAVASPAHAQIAPSPTPTPTATPSPTPTQINSDISSGGQVLNLGSNFLERLGNQATNGFSRELRNNPGGGGASEAIEGPRYRSWGEVYGLSVTTDPQGVFFGDKRRI